MRRVVIESPYAGDIERNVAYARKCMRHAIDRGESPIASHIIYTQPGILRDDDPNERALGISCGFAWWTAADLICFYEDFGWSSGMDAAMERALIAGKPFERRSIHKL